MMTSRFLWPDQRVISRLARLGIAFLAMVAVRPGCLAGSAAFRDRTDEIRVVDVAKIKRPGATVTGVELLPAGSFSSPAGSEIFPGLPAFCRARATLQSAQDSNITIEVWMPREKWNGRFLGTGNGGGGGKIVYAALAAGLKFGYAVANTDLGTSPNPEAVIDHPDRWRDFGGRATHEMTLMAKAMVQAYYNKPPHHSYFVGSSTGGQQALAEAQLHPDDYDGIIAGTPGNNRTHLHVMFVWNWQALHESPGSAFSHEQATLVTNAVVKARAGKDGGAPADDFLTDPRMSRFNPETLLKPAKGGVAGGAYLTREQVRALQKIYAGPVNPRTGERIYTPPPMGSERTMGLVVPEDPRSAPPHSYLFRWVFGSGYDCARFDFDRDLDRLDEGLAPLLNANNPDLSALRARGGKILMYSGTADPVTPFQDAVNYYERVIEAQGGLATTQDFFRYFIVPGLAHGSGGPGLNDFGQKLSLHVPLDAGHHALMALVKWVEEGVPPNEIIATAFIQGDPAKGIRFQRPIYPYPQFPHYREGDVNAPSSYRAVVHPRGQVLVPAERYLK